MPAFAVCSAAVFVDQRTRFAGQAGAVDALALHPRMVQVMSATPSLASSNSRSGMPVAAGAQDRGFTYVEGGLFGGFLNGVEKSGTFTGTGRRPTLESGAGAGGFIAGAWQFRENLHTTRGSQSN